MTTKRKYEGKPINWIIDEMLDLQWLSGTLFQHGSHAKQLLQTNAKVEKLKTELLNRIEDLREQWVKYSYPDDTEEKPERSPSEDDVSSMADLCKGCGKDTFALGVVEGRQQAMKETEEALFNATEDLCRCRVLFAQSAKKAADLKLYCRECKEEHPHRYAPSPDAGPYWRCGRCGAANWRAAGIALAAGDER